MVEGNKILVTGSAGQLGSEIRDQVPLNDKNQWTFWDRNDMDLTDPQSVTQKITSLNPDVVIHCAAYTAVDKAEEEFETCFSINEKSVKVLGAVCAQIGCKVILISTDYVYHLNKTTPLVESDPTHPRGVYARSKRGGELELIRSGGTSIIVRTSWVYGTKGSNFIKTILRLATERASINVVDDQIGALTWTRDLAHALIKIATEGTSKESQWNEIYNYSNQGQTNWAQIAQKIVKQKELDLKINPIPSSEYPTPAPRPKWSVLSSDKIMQAFGLNIPDWEASLLQCLKEL